MSILSREQGRTVSVRRLTRSAVMLALALALGWLEGMLPPLPAPVPLRYGFANVAVMATLIFVGSFEAFSVAFLKSVFVFMTRGLIAGGVSMTGTLLSVGVMIALERLFERRTSVFLLSISGAIAHNAGQLIFLVLFLQYRISVLLVGPYLLLFGIVTGTLSGFLLYVMMKPLQSFLKVRHDSDGGNREDHRVAKDEFHK
jgi:heptaprenyl diphosphate synthase